MPLQKNVSWNGFSIKIVQCADEYTNTLKDTNSLKKANGTITDLKTYSNDSHIHGVKLSKTCVKSLGIYLGHHTIECYEKKLDK